MNKLTIEDLEMLKRIREVCRNSMCNKCLFHDDMEKECPFYYHPNQWRIEELHDRLNNK